MLCMMTAWISIQFGTCEWLSAGVLGEKHRLLGTRHDHARFCVGTFTKGKRNVDTMATKKWHEEWFYVFARNY